MKRYALLSAILLTVLMIGCSSDIPTVENDGGQTMLAPPPVYTEDQINQKILTGASKQIGWNGGQCKAWVQNLVPQVVSGRTIGPNYTSNSKADYYNAQWSPAGTVRVVWQEYPKNYCITKFPSSLKPGQIIQLRWRSDVAKYWNCCNNGPHTAIIKSVSTTNMEWYDSNFNSDLIVRLHSFSMAQWQKYVAAWTVYQVI
jgi:hypothetical protein